MMRLSFKKEKRDGGSISVGSPYQNVTVKGDRKWVGTIYAPNWRENGWRVHLMINSEGGNCPFQWIHLGTFNEEEQAMEWVKTNWKTLNERYAIRPHERESA